MKIKVGLFLCIFLLCFQESKAQFHTIQNKPLRYKVNVAEQAEIVEPVVNSATDESPELNMKKKNEDIPLMCFPLDTLVTTSPFGYRQDPFTGKRKMHNGIDFRASGDNVYSMMAGKVIKVGYDKLSGNYVTLQHGNITVSYCHLSQVIKKKNNIVAVGEVVGITGNTGRSTGEHLHLTCKIKGRVIDPSFILDYVTRLRLTPNCVLPNT